MYQRIYADQLRSRLWQQRRLKIFERDAWRCRHPRCPDPDDIRQPLVVHHLVYYSGHAPWDYGDDDLVTWCQRCHDLHHRSAR